MAPPPAPKNPGKFNATLQSLVGVYENDYYGRCEILQDGDGLKAVWSGEISGKLETLEQRRVLDAISRRDPDPVGHNVRDRRGRYGRQF